MPNPPPTHAFILGAGLGTRLRPLTLDLPKPLVPIHGVPLVIRALRHLRQQGIRDVVINTHHAAQCWKETFPTGCYEDVRLVFRHEPVLLDTGGGLKNVEDLLAGHGDFIIYNGDILTNLPIEKAIRHHQESDNLATLVLRSSGGPLHIKLGEKGQVIDICNTFGHGSGKNFLFTGIHIVCPKIFSHIPYAGVQSIISIYLDLISKGFPLGGVVLDEGRWSDIGTMEEYTKIQLSE